MKPAPSWYRTQVGALAPRDVCIYVTSGEYDILRACVIRDWNRIVASLTQAFGSSQKALEMAEQQHQEIYQLVQLLERKRA